MDWKRSKITRGNEMQRQLFVNQNAKSRALDQGLNWNHTRKNIKVKENMVNAFTELEKHGPVNKDDFIAAFRKEQAAGNIDVKKFVKKYLGSNFSKLKKATMNHERKQIAINEAFARNLANSKRNTLKQRVQSRKAKDVNTRLNDLEDRVSEIEKIFRKGKSI